MMIHEKHRVTQNAGPKEEHPVEAVTPAEGCDDRTHASSPPHHSLGIWPSAGQQAKLMSVAAQVQPIAHCSACELRAHTQLV